MNLLNPNTQYLLINNKYFLIFHQIGEHILEMIASLTIVNISIFDKMFSNKKKKKTNIFRITCGSKYALYYRWDVCNILKYIVLL